MTTLAEAQKSEFDLELRRVLPSITAVIFCYGLQRDFVVTCTEYEVELVDKRYRRQVAVGGWILWNTEYIIHSIICPGLSIFFRRRHSAKSSLTRAILFGRAKTSLPPPYPLVHRRSCIRRFASQPIGESSWPSWVSEKGRRVNYGKLMAKRKPVRDWILDAIRNSAEERKGMTTILPGTIEYFFVRLGRLSGFPFFWLGPALFCWSLFSLSSHSSLFSPITRDTPVLFHSVPRVMAQPKRAREEREKKAPCGDTGVSVCF